MLRKAALIIVILIAGFVSGLKCSDYNHSIQTRTPAGQIVPLDDTHRAAFNMDKARIIE